MKRLATPLILTLIATACGESAERPGTQIGFEDALSCTLISSETLTDLEEIPDGLNLSPREVIDNITGSYVGQQLNDYEEPTADAASATVSDPAAVVTVLHYEGFSDMDGGDVAHLCPSRYAFELEVALHADGFPSFEGTIGANYSDGGDGDPSSWARSSDESLFDDELPSPVTFDPDDWGLVEPVVLLSGNGLGGLYTTLSWNAYNPDEVVEGQDYTREGELLFHALLEHE
jgi:hypothetical protein